MPKPIFHERYLTDYLVHSKKPPGETHIPHQIPPPSDRTAPGLITKMASSSSNAASTSAPLLTSLGKITITVKEVDLSTLNDQIRDDSPITDDELKAITSAVVSTATWAMKHLPVNTMATAAPDQGHMFRVTPLYRQIGGRMSLMDARSVAPSALVPGNWMIYGPTSSPLPAMSSLVAEKYSTLPEKYLIRKDTTTKRMYVCIPASPWATWATADNTNNADNSRCDHCICIGGRVNPAGGARALAPKALCHFHSFYMTTGKTLTRCEQLALDQLDSDGVPWTPQQTAVFVALLKRRLGRLALLYDSEELPSLTAAQSRVVGMDYGAIGDGRSMVKKARSGADLEDDGDDEHVGGVVAGGLDPTDDDVFT